MKTFDLTNEIERLARAEKRAELRVLMDYLIEEYGGEVVRQKQGNTDEIRREAVNRILEYNRRSGERWELKKCFTMEINGENMQVFGTSCYMIALREAYWTDAEMWTEKERKDFRFRSLNCFNKGNLNFKPIEYDLAEIKAYFRYWRSSLKPCMEEWEQECGCILHIGNVAKVGYNAEYVTGYDKDKLLQCLLLPQKTQELWHVCSAKKSHRRPMLLYN